MSWIDDAIIKMKKNGITQKAISERTGFSEHGISKIFAYKTKARESTKKAIEAAINDIISERSDKNEIEN